MADQVRTAHLLIKHTGSRNPVSRRTGGQVTLSPEDALAELRSYEAKIHAEGVPNAFPKYGESVTHHVAACVKRPVHAHSNVIVSLDAYSRREK